MGSIMSLGVSVSNSVMLVTFMDEHWKGGAISTKAAILGAGERLRPILMTALRDDRWHGANGPGAGAGEPDAGAAGPGRDRRPGDVDVRHLAGAPSIFAVVIGRRCARSPSVYPDDPESAHYDPHVFADRDGQTPHVRIIRRLPDPGHSHALPDGCATLHPLRTSDVSQPRDGLLVHLGDPPLTRRS